MLHPDDTLLFWLIIIIIFFFLLRFLFQRIKYPIPKEPVDINDDVVQMLDREGFTTLGRKIRIPVTIKSDDKIYESRYFIDALAEKDGLTYVVRVSRQKQPLSMTGSGIRDHLIPYYLLGEYDGLLYVDREQGKIYSFTIYLDHERILWRKGKILFYVIFFLFGFVLGIILI